MSCLIEFLQTHVLSDRPCSMVINGGMLSTPFADSSMCSDMLAGNSAILLLQYLADLGRFCDCNHPASLGRVDFDIPTRLLHSDTLPGHIFMMPVR